jgi:hypothetical protein
MHIARARFAAICLSIAGVHGARTVGGRERERERERGERERESERESEVTNGERGIADRKH